MRTRVFIDAGASSVVEGQEHQSRNTMRDMAKCGIFSARPLHSGSCVY